MRTLRRVFAIVLATICLAPIPCPVSDATFFEDGRQGYYTIYDETGAVITTVSGDVNVDDGYISRDNTYYVVQSVDDGGMSAIAQNMGQESMPVAGVDSSVQASAATQTGQGMKIALYVTHSDESYENIDGGSSSEGRGGIYDVAEALKTQLEKLGVQVEFSENTHHPHDAGAYRRSRQTAVDLLKTMPSAIIDIHRDGIPDPGEYTTEVNGEDVTMVRLLVGRSNPNAEVNKEFAKKLKAVADEMYPSLVKDIFIGKGNYNQELAPHSVLLEFGTHTSDKEQVLASVPYMAQVLSQTVFGSTGGQSGNQSGGTGAGTDRSKADEPISGDGKGSSSGILWILGVVLVGGAALLLVTRGKDGFWRGAGRSVSELTGGLIGKKAGGDKPDRDSEGP